MDVLKEIPEKEVRCCVTSPPYFGLRNYGHEEQIGLEETPEEYIKALVLVFDEVKRVLTDDGTLWLNIGDSYWGGKGQSGQGDAESQAKRALAGVSLNQDYHQMGGKGHTRPADKKHETIKPKDLIGIPWMLAFALRSSGWYLRQDIIWHKPNPMPESVTDRCTNCHEYIFLLSKSKQYFYDYEAIKEPLSDMERTNFQSGSRSNGINKDRNDNDLSKRSKDAVYENRNKRSVWTINTRPYSEAHFATFPPELIVDCIKAGSAEGDIILDPFSGAGTTAMVSAKLNRNFIAIEINQKYVDIANRRLDKELGMFRK